MQRKYLIFALAPIMLIAAPVLGSQLSGFLAYQYADEADHGIGPGLDFSIPLEPQFRVGGRVSWYHFGDIDLDMVPLAAIGAVEQEIDAHWTIYGGVGLGWYFLSANRGTADDSFGVQLLTGAEWRKSDPWGVFCEVRWLFLETDVDETFQLNEGTDDELDLGGIGLNIGLNYRF